MKGRLVAVACRNVGLALLFWGLASNSWAQAPILEYLFDDGATQVALNTGTLGGISDGTILGATLSTDTPQGSTFSMNFDGFNHYISVPDAFDYGSALTIEAWVNPDSVTGTSYIWEDYGFPGVIVGLVNGSVQFSLSTTEHPGSGITNLSGSLEPGSWQHVAAVYDGAEMRIYVGGQLGGTVATSGSIFDNGNLNAAVGADNTGLFTFFFDGGIDDLRIFDAALTVDQLADGAFITDPIPEPSSALLLGMGCLGLVALARRQRRSCS